MSYYDNVKSSINEKEDKSFGKKGGGNSGNFETLRKAAEEQSEEDEESRSNDADIEVLEEGLSEKNSSNQSPNQGESSDSEAGQVSRKPVEGSDLSGVEKKLDKIIEQNERMIEILESFGS